MKVIKRDGKIVPYDGSKILLAIEKAMADIGEINEVIATNIEEDIMATIDGSDDIWAVEEIQDEIEKQLTMNPQTFNIGKQFILYRNEKKKYRDKNIPWKYKLLSKEFLSTYKKEKNPMNQLGTFVYSRTYSRWVEEEGRRENWWETVARAVDYNCNLVKTSKEEAETLYDNIFNLRQFLSGRTFWVGGTKVAEDYPMANFNCAFSAIDNFNKYKSIFYLLMVGSGVGLRILKEDVARLPRVRTNIEVINEAYVELPKESRKDSTSLTFTKNNSVKIIVGDSKSGWVNALDFYLKILYSIDYKDVETVVINYDNIRPKGERLKTFGGTASGHRSLENMFVKINKIITNRGIIDNKNFTHLKPIDCLDIANIIGENVVVGGVRRTAEIVLVDADDEECIQAKNGLYKEIEGQWIVDEDIIHRQMSNNSIYYKSKPSRERLHWQIEQMRYSGEPAWVNEVAGAKRRTNMNGVNPCGEILLDSNGLCNLTTINVASFVLPDGTLDRVGLLEAQKLSARAGYRMTCVELEIPEWNYVQDRDKLLGCSLTGWQDMVNGINLSYEGQKELLRELRSVATNSANEYADHIGQNRPLLTTTVKPEGTLSQLPTVSSGVHYSHSPYYIRRVRINAQDPLSYVCEELGYPIFPEVGQEWETCSTKVIEFPIKSPTGRTKYDVSALEQLNNYKMFMENYVQHNCSITVHVRENEWDLVEQWIWDNWDDVVAVSFLALEDSFYQLLPYEAIDKTEYEARVKNMKMFIPNLLGKYEKKQQELDIGTEGCESGVCPIR